MNERRLPSAEEINAAYDEGRTAVIVLFQRTFLGLAERIQKLEDQRAKNSRRRAMGTINLHLARKVCANAPDAKVEDNLDIVVRP